MDREGSLAEVLKEIEAVASWRYEGRPPHLPQDAIPVGFFCPYVPEELIHAAGALPFRLLGSPKPIAHAKAHLPPFCCHLVKSSFESLLLGDLGFLRGVVFSHTCDAMQGLSEIWAHQKLLPFHFTLMVPSNMNSGHARSYLKSEIERFREFLESQVGKIAPQQLKASIQLFNRIRMMQKELYAAPVSARQFAQAIRAGYLMDRVRYLRILQELLRASQDEAVKDHPLVPIYLAGNMVHSETYFDLIESSGARVVQDDLCSGARTFRLMTREDGDPIEALTDRYFQSFFCPSKHLGPHAHLETTTKEVSDSGAKGVIFLLYKYCEAHFFDYPDIKSALESKGIPTLLLEVEDPSHSHEQLKIRIQAFVEMLSSD